MNKIKGLLLSLSLLLLALVVGIFIREQKAYSAITSEIKDSQIEDKKEAKNKENNKKETNPTEVTDTASDKFKEETFDAGEVRAITKGEKEYTGEKVVFLTFDDGPDGSSSPRILDILDSNNVPATFFLQGQYINEDTKDIFKRMYDEGHCVAAHSFGHDYGYLYPGRVGNAANIISDFNKIQERAKEYLGKDFSFKTWRYPGGHMSWQNLESADEQLKAQGVEWIDWNNMTGDAEPASRRPTTAQGMVNMVKQLTEGSSSNMQVILMHDNRSKELTIQALPEIIAYYKDLGYKFGKFK
ncbi:polysaccharide deacetylase family protein [Lagierella sp.]|uniref:polysaccharide deacetylase family protein n=1 Tax=Lagierella sp. TaxID=2849657 RepID=UPI00262E96D2|nr:polysaccharide deacetylase family protein [Lagierella sp.]